MQPVLADDAIEQRAGRIVQLAGRAAVLGVIEDGWKTPFQLPRREEKGPVDVRHEIFERDISKCTTAEKCRRWNRRGGPVDLQPVGGRRCVRYERPIAAR